MKNKIFKIILLLAIITTYGSLKVYAQHEGHMMPHQKEPAEIKTTTAEKRYQCPMHPQVVSDKPGKCPICGMDLVAVSGKTEADTEGGVVKIKQSQQELIGVKVEPVVTRPLMRMIRTIAQIAFDPGLYSAQAELIQANKTRLEASAAESAEIKERLDSFVHAAELKLKLLGLSDDQIAQLKNATTSDRGLLISDARSPYVWAYLTIYEYDLGLVKVGDHVVLQVIAYPGEEFDGKIIALDPVIDRNSRSVRARVQVNNSDGKLKPNMYGDAFIHIDLGQQLAVPQEAVLDTGLRKLVYVKESQEEFQAKEVELGTQAVAVVSGAQRKFYPVKGGLKENDVVVTTGNFLIDSQSQLTGGMSALWGGATEIKQDEPPGHKH